MTIFKYKFLFGLFFLLLSLNSCIINREMMFKTPKDGSFKYDSIPLYPYEEYKIAVGDKISFDLNTNGGKNLIEGLTQTSVEGSSRGSGGVASSNGSNISGNALSGGREFIVKLDSTIDLPVLGALKLVGYTIQECEDTLEYLFKNQYQDPFIQLRVTNRRCVVFSGNGNSATIVNLMNPNTTLLEVLAMTGGIHQGGNARLVKVMRKVKGKREIYLIDVSTIDGLKYADMIIQGDDYIYIEPRTRLIQGAIAELAPILSLMSTFAVVYTLIRKY
jgi:polysaccharide export outer membrane protein